VCEVRVLIGDKSYPASDIEMYRPEIKADFFMKKQSFQASSSGFSVPVIIGQDSFVDSTEIILEFLFRDGDVGRVELGSTRFSDTGTNNGAFGLSEESPLDDLLVVCMATYNPDPEHFRRQVASIVAQDFENWICFVCDDKSSQAARNSIRAAINGDPRFFFVENEENLGFYENFERCLKMVPSQAKYVAFADQDDIWYPNKLSACIKAFDEDTQLVYSDMKIVDKDRNVLSPAYWQNRKNYYRSEDIDLLTLANTVTGAASVFRRELLKIALPFPPRCGAVFHDQWLAILAAGNGGIKYVDESLYEYVQYDSNGRNLKGRVPYQAFVDGLPKSETKNKKTSKEAA